MIIKFTKEHVAGIPKGAVKELSTKIGERFIEQGYAEESTQPELDKYNKKMSKVVRPDLLTEAKEEANASNGCEDCGGNCDECGEKEVEEVKFYAVLTEEDIDANVEASEGFSAGDEVESNESGAELLTNDEGKFIGRDLGNV